MEKRKSNKIAVGVGKKLKYIFLEANFSPMFLHFERETGCPITEDLIELLTS